MANQIKYQVGFDIQQNSLNQLKSSLQQIKKINLNDIMKINNSDLNSASNALREVQQDAQKVENALNKAFNTKLNTINIQTFNKELSSSNLTIEQIYQSFSRAGAAGQNAFNNLANQVLNTNLKLRQSNRLLDSMATSMANTVKWGITSSIFNNMTGAIQKAYYYAKDLDQSLTDIRIVTGDSADQMERFAQVANNAAKDLGRSTLDYTKAALSFYQQGLNDEEVQARATTTLKAQNITGMGSQMIDNLTAVWNGFQVAAEDTEVYVDKLAAVADTSASNMGQLATAISKVASTANAMGVDIDQLTGQIATIIATTRQAPQSVGVALKTIYARMNDIKTGSDEAQISLGNYSGKMAQLGFNVLDATGHLRDTGEVIEEIGSRWQELTRQQQINLAQTMAGQRQYNNLIALFDGWDAYLRNVNTSLNAQGTLNEKNDRYLESLEAHMEQLGTQAERTYDILFDTDTVKGFVDLLDGVLTKFNDFIGMFSSGASALTNLGLIAANVFNKQIANGIDKTINTFEKKITNAQNIKAINDNLNQIDQGLREESNTYSGQAKLDGERQSLQIKKRILQVSSALTQSEYQELESLRSKIQEERTLAETIKNRQQIAEEIFGLGEMTDAQILARIQNQEKLLNQKKQQLTYMDNILMKAAQNVEGQQAVYTITTQEQQKLKEILGSEEAIAQCSEVIRKLKEGEVLSQQDINLLTKNVSDEIRQQSSQLVTIKQLKEAVLAYQRGEYDSIQAALEADRQRTAEIQKQAARRQLINSVVAKGTAIVQATQAVIAGINQATNEAATGAERVNGYWTATTASLAGIANFLHPGAGLLVQGVSSIIQSLLKGTDIYKNWEESLKSIEQRINDLKNQQEQVLKISNSYNADRTQIQNISKEFDELSVKAGQYNQNLSSMSEEQQARYHELVEEIISKNPDLVAGYTAQGDAIIANNDAIKNTLDYLDKQYEKQMAILYAKQNVANAEKILQDQYKNAQEASKTQSQYNVEDQLQNAQNNEINQARLFTSLQKSREVRDPTTGQIMGYQMINTDLGDLRQALIKLANNPDYEDIYKDFEFCISEYNKVVNKSDVTLEEIERARNDLEHNLSTLQYKISFLDWNNIIDTGWHVGITGPSAGKITEDTANIIKDNLNSLILDVDTLRSGLHEAEQQVEKEAAKINEDAESSSQELSAALVSYRNYLFGALRYDPEYNSQFLVIRDQWGEQFTPQIQTLLESIMQDWVNTIGEDSKYLSEQNMTEAIVKDFNTFIENSFKKINPQDIISVQEQITKLLDQANKEEISGTEYQNKLHEIINKFINSDSFKQMLQEDLKTNGNTDFSKLFLRSIFGQNINIGSVGEDIIADYTTASERIANRVSNTSKEMVQKLLSESGYTKQQLSTLADQIEKEDLYFSNWFDYLNYARTFLGQTSQAIEEQGSKLSQGFDKVNNAIGKIQSGKELSYKDKLNLMEYLGLSPQDVENTDIILQKFKQQINSLQGLQRFEGLSKIFTDFDTLKQHFKDFNIEEFGDEYNALWQNILDSELNALNIDQTALQNWATNRGMIFDGVEKNTQKALNAYKIEKDAESLQKLAQTVKEAGDKVDTSSEDFIELQTQLQKLTGDNWDAQDVISMLDAIAAYTDDGIQKFQTYAEWLNYIKNNGPEQTSQMSAASKYKEDKTNLDNLQGVSKSLTGGSQLSQDQSKAFAQVIANNEELQNIVRQTGDIYSTSVITALDSIIERQSQSLQLTRQQALEENLLAQQRIDRQIEQAKLDYEGEELAALLNTLQEDKNAKILEQIELREKLNKQEQPQHELDTDVNKDDYQNLTNYVRATAQANEDFADSLEQDVEGAEQVSEALLRYKAALQAVSKNYDKWIEKLNSGDVTQQAEATNELANAYGDLLDLPSDAFSDEFIKDAENLQLLQDAVNNVDGAYETLMEKAHQEILTQVGLDDSRFQLKINILENQIANGLDDIEAGAFIDDSQAIQAMNQLINMAGMTATQAQDLLGSMGVEAEVEQAKVPKSGKDEFVNADATVTYEQVESPIVVPFLGALGSTKVSVPSITYSGDKETVPKEGQETVTALRVKTARKSTGGGIKRRNVPYQGSSGGNKSGGGKGKGGKGKGGGGKATQPDKSQKDIKKPLEDQRDLYHDINIELKQIDRSLSRTQKIQDRLYGKQLLDNLTKQQDLLEKHKKTLEQKQKIQQQDLVSQQQALKNLGATFDQYGNISNYMTLIGQKQNQVNELINKENELVAIYNKETNKNAKKAIADQLEKRQRQTKEAEDDLKKTQDKIKDYDKLREDMQDLIDEIEEQTQKQIEIEIQKFRMEVQIRLDMGQAQRDWNKFRRQVLEKTDLMQKTAFNDIFAGMGQNINDLYSYFDVHGSTGTIETLTNQLLQTKKQIEDIDNLGKSAIYGDNKAKAMQDLQNDLKQLMNQMEDVEKIIDDIDQAYLDTIDDVEKQFNKQIEDYEYINELVQHNMDLLQLLYGDKNYDAMNNYYETLQRNNLNHLDSLKQQRTFWKEQWDAAVARGDTNAAEKFKENYKKTITDLNKTIEDSAKVLKDKYANSVDAIFDGLDKKLSNGHGTDYLEMQWDLMNKNADEYLDTVNTAFAVQQTERKYQKALDDTKSIKNQQALKKLMNEQLDILKNKEKVTQYDVDRAEKLLQVEQARIALEQAQSAKTSLRLKRDSQGNYSYEYAADSGSIDDAQANLAQAQNDLYNFDKDRYKSNLDDMLSAWKDFRDEYKDILLDVSLSDQQRIEKLTLLESQYADFINNKTDQNLVVRNNLMGSAFSELAAMYETDVANYNQMAEKEKQILMENLVPMWDSGIQQMTDKFAQEGGFIPTCEQAFENLDDATKDYQVSLDDLAQAADINFRDIQNGIDQTAVQLQDLIQDNNELITTMGQELTAVASLRIQAQLLAAQYDIVYTSAKQAASAIQEFIQAQQKTAASDASNNSFNSFSSGISTSNNISSGISASNNNSGDYYVKTDLVAGMPAETTWHVDENGDPMLDRIRFSRFATGGYTGDWENNNGKLAILDKKELVLNQQDTTNLLDSVKIMRSVMSTLHGNMIARFSDIKTGYSSLIDDKQNLEQDVHIEANFPNVNSKREIEEAFSELVNLAAQRIMR